MSFIKPQETPGIEAVWLVGQKKEVTWKCDFSVINIRLWQEDPERNSARPGATVFQSDSIPLPTTFTWTVDTGGHNTSRSNMYYLSAWNTSNPSEQDSLNLPSGSTGTTHFESGYFIIEQSAQVSSSSRAVSVLTTTVSATATSLAPTDTAPPNSAAPEALLLATLGWILWRRRNQRKHEVHEAASSEIKKPWGGRVVEMAVGENPVEVGAADPKPVELGQ